MTEATVRREGPYSEMCSELLDALGLAGQRVERLTMEFTVEPVVHVTVQLALGTTDAVRDIFRRYRLCAEERSEEED